mmetsp:Transcript_5523/g.12051  ORF Transcript_5523/g.12051 Transcript_5523/m.12051 type:complete len:209 (-) Transcript_5523:214-840(-)|eukprot:CAMPEP_0172552834 /NCGR_PEP_ID=MMETSP1067-20121228/47219_1 /TAXON_ID=265564 ORGANISM="Thalassiosira punctigera, Strain Tpunct2005C2" /NCGR_SAMPLE_ID=MMETSP1067 /ASSEMBLY_ACC=CAM_ASM_000444 /LENGTH=208 /DNA_ID=CAMNT_0013340899 /DNA_START=218 /DNA_END=844 /DNA_ORIENTATION=+
MSLRRVAPRLLSRYNVSYSSGTIRLPKIFNVTNSLERGFSAPPNKGKKMTSGEVNAALHDANEAMKAYYSYPPEKVIALKKAKFDARHRDGQFYLQLGLGVSLVCCFLITPFLGRKIAYDEEFKNKYIPEWYDYTIEKPKNAWTKEELHLQVMLLQKQLHERAIAGEFTPEKLEDMRRNLAKKPEKEEYAHFAQLHPGVDGDEDLEDD